MAANKVEIVEYQPWHGGMVSKFMRNIDRREIYYTALLTPAAAVGFTTSTSVGKWTGLVDGEVAAIFGVARRSAISSIGVPWLLSTDAIERVPVTVARKSRVYFERIARAFPVMENHVLAENVQTVDWLKWLGFDMEEAKPYGAFGAPFIRFGKGLDKCA
jgi:hypothetical protein